MMLSRREILRIGSLGILGGLSRRATAERVEGSPTASAKHCIYIMLQGGPSHIDLWDLKPNAPPEVRGPFSPISTSVPGTLIGELLPRTAKLAGELAIVRSMEHRFSNHIAGTYIMLTGSTNQPDADREAKADDFPGPGAVLNYLHRGPVDVPVSVSLPNWLSIPGPSNRMPGQYAGMLGSANDPFLISGEPESDTFAPLRLSIPDEVGAGRFQARVGLRAQIDAALSYIDGPKTRNLDRMYQTAYELLTDPRVRLALDLSREPDTVRDRYGRTKLGQSLLLARRLIEAGVTFVAFNAFNQAWDHHGNIRDTLRHHVPRMDQPYSALIEDLRDRRLLDETLVVNTGEFGRTPTINKDAGRDHWPFAYSTVLAGGGVKGGVVHGATDSKGAYVTANPVSPADLLATLWTCLGIDPASELRDRLGRPITLCGGKVVRELLRT